MRQRRGDGERGRPPGTDGARTDDGRPAPGDEPTLTVVVVTRNEADRITDCLDSVFEACRDGPTFEVILVDSNSTDATLDFAVEYPIDVYQITDESLTTPGAGRFVGTRMASGDRLLFVDGDMVLSREWLPRALDTVDEPAVAGVDGYLNEVGDVGGDHDVEAVRGVALYDAGALDRVGGFDPYLRSVEDIDVGFRLGAAGYRLRRLAVVAAHHPASNSLGEPVRRWRNGYPLGPGQALRRSIGRPTLFRKHLRRLRYKLLAGGWLVIGAIAVLVWPLFVGWLLFSAIGAVGLSWLLGPRGALQYLLHVGFGLAGLVPGFAMPVESRESFPMDSVRLVQPGPSASSVRQFVASAR